MELQAKRALARLVEAAEDLKTAKILVDKLQSRSLFHSQQCVEKALKGCLSKVLVGEITSHTVVKLIEEKLFPLLPETLKQEFKELRNDAFWTERRWIDTRYEELKPGEKIELPVFKFTTTDARKGIQAAEKTINWAIKCIQLLFEIELSKNYTGLKELGQKYLK